MLYSYTNRMYRYLYLPGTTNKIGDLSKTCMYLDFIPVVPNNLTLKIKSSRTLITLPQS